MENQKMCKDERSPENILSLLRRGNKAYEIQSCKFKHKQLRVMAQTQAPYAVILTCSDSRVVPEFIFSAQAGELFVIRNVGNVVDDLVLSSIQYGIDKLGASMVLVMGHKDCGAIHEALTGGTLYLKPIINKIIPVINQNVEAESCEEKNVRSAMKSISKIKGFSGKINSGALSIEGAIYDPITRGVQFLPKAKY